MSYLLRSLSPEMTLILSEKYYTFDAVYVVVDEIDAFSTPAMP